MALTTNTKVWQIMFVIFILISLLFYGLFYFNTIFIAFILGMALIIVTEKMMKDYNRRMKKYKLNRLLSKLLGFAMVFFWIFVIFFTLGSSVTEFGDVVDKIENSNQSLTNYYVTQIEPFFPNFIRGQLQDVETVKAIEDQTVSALSGILSGLSVFIVSAVLIIPIMFYMYFRRRKELSKQLFDLIPKKFHDSFIRASRDIGQQFHDFISAKVFESIVVGSICCFGFFVAGLKGWLALGILAGFLNIVPYLGPIIGAIPPILVAFLDQPIIALYVIITVLIAQAVDNFYLIPFMITGRVRMDPLLGIVLILIGAKLFGIMGMIFAIPIFLVYKIILREVYSELVKVYKNAN